MTKKIVCYEEEKSSIMTRFYSASITYNENGKIISCSIQKAEVLTKSFYSVLGISQYIVI